MSSRTCSILMMFVFLSSDGRKMRADLSGNFVSGGMTKTAQLVRLAILGIWSKLSKNMCGWFPCRDYFTLSIKLGGSSAVKVLRSPPFGPGMVISRSLACKKSRSSGSP